MLGIRRVLLVVLLLVLLPGQMMVQAQSDCNEATAVEFIERGDAHYADGDYEAAIADYSCAIVRDPDNSNLRNDRGNAYYELNLLDLAKEDYLTATQLDPRNAIAYYNLGYTHYFMGDSESALDAFTRAITIDDADHLNFFGRAVAYFEQGHYDESLTDVNQSIDLDDQFGASFLLRAWIYLLQESDEPPHADFLRWIELEETTSTTQTLEEALSGGDLDIAEGQVYRLSFEARTGEIFGAAAASDDPIDPLLVLVAPDGTPIASDDDSGVNLNAVIQRMSLPQSGTYTLVLSQSGADDTGTIHLSINRQGQLTSSDASQDADGNSFAQYNLYIDDVAEVFTTGNDRLNLRSGPGLDYEIVDKLERGERVTLLEGPRKESGYSWWRVRAADGAEGWAVERVETEQTLHLALTVGEDALVISGDEKLNVRATPQRGADLLFQLEDGTVVTLLEDPVIADNFRWWHIRDADGREGWLVDRIGIDRMIAPAREFPDR